MHTALHHGRGTVPLIWGAALVLSVVAHVGLFQINPQFLMGSGKFRDALPVRTRPDVVVRPAEPERLRRELPRLLEQAGQGDPTVPEVGGDELPTEESLSTGIADPTLPAVDVQLEMTDLPDAPETTEPESTWSPQQEVLAVTQPRVKETLDVLPRTFREVEEQVINAPDFSLPSERPVVAPQPAFATPGVPSRGVPRISLPPLGLPSGSAPSSTVPVIDKVPELTLPEVEPPELTELPEPPLVPTEDLLRLSVRVYDPPEEPDWRYFKLQLRRNGIESLERLPRDVIYVIDCSASMTERKLQLALQGVRTSLEALGEKDRIQVIAFRDRVETFPRTPMAATVFGKAQVRSFLSGLHARGQTDVFASLNALNTLTSESDRPVLAMFITDGVATQGVKQPGEILEAFTKSNQGRVSVFGLGGGERVSRVLLDFLGFRNRGTSLVSSTAEGLRAVIPRMATEISRPVLVNLEAEFTGAVPPDVYPASLSHLYVDRPWILIGRTPRSASRFAFQVVGQSSESGHDILFPVDLDTSTQGGAHLRKEWAWQAGLQKLSEAIASSDPEAFTAAEAFLKRYELEVPSAYRN